MVQRGGLLVSVVQWQKSTKIEASNERTKRHERPDQIQTASQRLREWKQNSVGCIACSSHSIHRGNDNARVNTNRAQVKLDFLTEYLCRKWYFGLFVQSWVSADVDRKNVLP